MTDKMSVRCTLKIAYEEINDKIKISNQDIRGISGHFMTAGQEWQCKLGSVGTELHWKMIHFEENKEKNWTITNACNAMHV